MAKSTGSLQKEFVTGVDYGRFYHDNTAYVGVYFGRVERPKKEDMNTTFEVKKNVLDLEGSFIQNKTSWMKMIRNVTGCSLISAKGSVEFFYNGFNKMDFPLIPAFIMWHLIGMSINLARSLEKGEAQISDTSTEPIIVFFQKVNPEELEEKYGLYVLSGSDNAPKPIVMRHDKITFEEIYSMKRLLA